MFDAYLARNEGDEDVAQDSGDVENDENQYEPMLGARVHEACRRLVSSVIVGSPIPIVRGSLLLVVITTCVIGGLTY